MTTPQNELYNLSYKIKELHDLFISDDGLTDMFEEIAYIHRVLSIISKDVDELKSQMSLIIKLLSK